RPYLDPERSRLFGPAGSIERLRELEGRPVVVGVERQDLTEMHDRRCRITALVEGVEAGVHEVFLTGDRSGLEVVAAADEEDEEEAESELEAAREEVRGVSGRDQLHRRTKLAG